MIKIYQVGGSVRDKFLGVKSKDIDYAIEAPSFDAMRDEIRAQNGLIYLETPQYFTIRAKLPLLGDADFTLCRKDGNYSDGRRPDSVTIGTIYDDLARRDFTMNAIAIDTQTGDTLDPYNGFADIKANLIRCVGSPIARFNEDKLRVFRALRFAITKNFTIESDTAWAMNEINDFSGVSTERIREELFKMFKADTQKSFAGIFLDYPALGRIVCERGLRFFPTIKEL